MDGWLYRQTDAEMAQFFGVDWCNFGYWDKIVSKLLNLKSTTHNQSRYLNTDHNITKSSCSLSMQGL